MDDFRRFFLRGLGVLVPTLLTFAIVVWAFRLINDNVGHYITEGLLQLCMMVRDEPAPGFVDETVDPLRYGTPMDSWDADGHRLTIEHMVIENHKRLQEKKLPLASPQSLKDAAQARSRALWRIGFAKYYLHLLSFVLAIILVYFTGFFLASFIGRASWRGAERLLSRVPLIRAIYPNVKQVTDFLLSDRTVEFSGVVAVEYPRKGMWSVGLRTGGPMKRLQSKTETELVTVFIPSSPTPVTGYVVQVALADVIDLNMTIDEALRFTISGGVIKPDAELPSPRTK